MKKWMGLFLVVMLVMTSVLALADKAPYQDKGGHGPYNAGILPEVKEEIISGNKAYQDAYNTRYAAGIAFRQTMRAAGIQGFDLDALLDSFEVNRSNTGFVYQDLFPTKNGVSTSLSPMSITYIFYQSKLPVAGLAMTSTSRSSYELWWNIVTKTVDYIR